MRRAIRVSAPLLLAALAAAPASAQGLYPGPYINFGWGNNARNPNADFLKGFGYFNRARAEADVKEAEASKLRAEAFARWNQALGEARRAKELQEARRRSVEEVQTAIENRAALIESGEILDQRLDHILQDPSPATHDALSAIPLPADVLRDIPFENASEPIAACLDVLTQEDGWPPLLRQPAFADGRAALAAAVDAALKEDLDGPISADTRGKLDAALQGLHAALDEENRGFPAAGGTEADQFLRTLAAMVRLLEDPKGGEVVRLLESYPGGSLADLVNFMHAYNLRFGRATSDRQKEIYRELDRQLTSVPVGELSPDDEAATRPLVEHSRVVGDAAKQVFSDLSWADLDPPAPADGKD